MFYLIYKITNNINKKIYIGSHKTKNKDDSYMGSGKYLNRAINKYGVENFTKEILFVFDNAKEMYDKEAEIVDDDFLAEENTYNLKRGGFGGFDYINSSGLQHRRVFTEEDINKSIEWRKNNLTPELYSERIKRLYSRRTKESVLLQNENGRQVALKMPSKEKRKETFERIQHQQGPLNSQYGSMWVTDGLVNKKINKDDLIPGGWKKGRIVMK